MLANDPLPQVRAALERVHIGVTCMDGRVSPLAEALRSAGTSVTELALTRIETLDVAPLAQAIAALDQYGWVLLTSAPAVRQLAVALEKTGVSLGACKIAVSGAATAAAVERLGWQPTLVPGRMPPEPLADAMAARGDVDGARMLYPAADGGRDVMPGGLRALGAMVDVIPVYRSAPDPDAERRLRELVSAGQLDLVTVETPSVIDALLAALPAEYARRLPVACVGSATARAARMAGFPVKVACENATIPSFVRSIVAAFASTE